MASQIKSIMDKRAKDLPNDAFHVKSALNWLRYEIQIDFLATLIPSRSRILELGCGWGHATAMLAAARPDIEIIGTDILKSPTWGDLTKFGCTFMQCDATRLPFNGEEFDAIVSFGVMEHTNKDLIFLKEIHRCLANQGYNILFNLPNIYSLSEYASRRMGIWHHDKRYRLSEIEELLEKSSFKIVSIELEHLIPAQVARISINLAEVFNKYYININKIDEALRKTPLSSISQDFRVISRKI